MIGYTSVSGDEWPADEWEASRFDRALGCTACTFSAGLVALSVGIILMATIWR